MNYSCANCVGQCENLSKPMAGMGAVLASSLLTILAEILQTL